MSRKLRMYFFVPYNISEIQKGIQAGHAALQYANYYDNMPEYQEFIKHHKTWIILNGGTTRERETKDGIGTLNQLAHDLACNRIPFASFYEPDLNDALTALCFLCDDRVFDFENFPMFRNWLFGARSNFDEFSDDELKSEYKDSYSVWCELVGGRENVFLKELIFDKKLA